MNTPRKSRESEERPSQPADSAKKAPKIQVVSGDEIPEPTAARKPTTARVVKPLAGERLTPDEWKLRFAENLDRLVSLVGLSRKDAAGEMRVSYRLLRRIITAGVSRTDDRNLKSLTKIAEFFCLPSVEDLWRSDLVRWLIYSDHSGFVEKFRARLLAEREKRLEQFGPVRSEDLALLNRALGFDDTHVPMLTGPYADKVASILASSEAETFRRVIDAYDELVKRRSADADGGQGEERRTARG
jgi:predicted DNA-binding protein (UPF0251 family)